MDRDDFNNQNGYIDPRNDRNGFNSFYGAQNERRGYIDPSNPLGVNKSNQGFTQNPGYVSPFNQRPIPNNIPPYVPVGNIPPQQPIGQPIPQMPIMYEQNPNQVTNQDYEDQYYCAGQVPGATNGYMPPMPPMQPVQPQQKKKSFFGFKNKKPQENVTSYPNSQQFLNIQTPQNINDIRTIIDMIKSGEAVFVDFSKISAQDSQRMVDFLSGGCYGAGGLMKSMGEKKFVLTPPGTGIRGSLN